MNSIKHNLGNVFSIFSDYFFQQNNNKLIEDDPDLFWKELEENQRPPLPEGPIILMGEVIADDLFSLQKQMFSSCTGASLLFVEYMKTKGLTPENVLDLGCGVGANSSLLLKHGINVIGIDKMQVLLDGNYSGHSVCCANKET